MMRFPSNAAARTIAGVAASTVLAALYVRGGAAWMLGFLFLVPWLRTLDAAPTLGGALLRGCAMAVGFTAAAFAWFGIAVGQYAQFDPVMGVALLLILAPLFQPQFLVFAAARHLAGRQLGPVAGVLAGASAWVAAESLIPKLLGDTIGYGLYPSTLLRQAADLGGAPGLTLLLLFANEGVAAAIGRRSLGVRALATPLALAASVPLLLAAYGWTVLSAPASPAAQPLRVGLIQANITAYDRQRQEKGAHAVVREVLDTHFAMSYDAVVRQRADAVLWSETIYPTTFGQPKSEAGAEFDREILDIVSAAGVPFVFGTYDRDSAGEYNAAAFVQPTTGLLGFYRKTHLFPFTEYLPAWMDGSVTRRLMPWAGNWQAGNGARVMPLQLAGGREIPVLPLICFDDVHARLAIDGARLGAQVIFTMSNDSWFTSGTLGAEMHQAAAAFRSIETRLPQFRVTTNGYSAVIDAHGTVLAGTRMGERTLVIADVAVRSPGRTLMVAWGDWVGTAATAFLAALAAWTALRRLRVRLAPLPAARSVGLHQPVDAVVLPAAARVLAGLLRAGSRCGLLYMCIALLLNEALRTNTLGQLRMFAVLFVAPEVALWCVLFLFSATVTIEPGALIVTRGRRRLSVALADIDSLHLWRVPLPGPGLSLRTATGQCFHCAVANPHGLAAGLAAAGTPGPKPARPALARMHTYMEAMVSTHRSRLDHPLVRYALLSLALAIPAFHLQQYIAYGGPFGEYYTFGLKAYLTAFALWWGAWAIGVVLCDAVLRAVIEAMTLLAALLRPRRAAEVRRGLEGAGHAALFLGLPAWLMLTMFAR